MNAALVRQHFSYDPATGAFSRLDPSRLRREYVGWTRDCFEACCMRKSAEARLGFTSSEAS